MYKVTDINLASIIFAYGIDVEKDSENICTPKGQTLTFYFPESEQVTKIIDAFKSQVTDDEMLGRIISAFNIRKSIVTNIKKYKRIAIVESKTKNNTFAIIPDGLETVDIEEILGRLK